MGKLRLQGVKEFRMWDTINRKMEYGVNFNNIIHRLAAHGTGFITLPKEFIFMEFLNKHDTNRKRIYNGDIVEIRKISNNFEEGDHGIVFLIYKGYISFNKERASYGIFTKEGEYLWDLSTEFSDIRVIGNIYKTPELM